MSGVLATVASGHLLRLARARGSWTPARGCPGSRSGRVMTFGLETLLFVLLGLQAPQLADELDIGALALPGARRRLRGGRACG